MAFKINENCTKCGRCVKECPVDAIFKQNNRTYFIDDDLCASCEACLDVCRENAIELIP
jgi:ferredoxin